VLAEPGVRAAVADLSRRLGHLPEQPGRALDFEQERALRLLSSGGSTPLDPPIPAAVTAVGPATRPGLRPGTRQAG
jgi:hypothetical protein